MKRGVKPDVVTDETSAHDPLGGYIPIGLSVKEAEGLRVSDPEAYLKRSRKSIAIHVKAMIALGSKGSIVFEDGNGIRAQAKEAGAEDAVRFQGFVPPFIWPMFLQARVPLRR